jgi:hypothetical protein
MRISRAVVLVIDRLGAGWLGPYGNTWLDTPAFSRLAADSILIETAITDSADIGVYYNSVWDGVSGAPADNDGKSLADAVQSAGGVASLVTDDREVAEHALAKSFDERRMLNSADADEPATSVEATGIFRFFEAAKLALEQFSSPGLLWLHARGMAGAWDAPLEFRYQFADELDPEPPSFVEPPNRMLSEAHDPDEVLGIVQAYAGQVALADMCLGGLLDAFENHPLALETLLVLTSPRGYPLGEHWRVGPCDHALYGELLHTPLLLRVPGHDAGRLQRIVQPRQLAEFICSLGGWLPADGPGSAGSLEWLKSPSDMDVAYATVMGQRAIRTKAWFLRQLWQDSGWQSELFAKPDDRFEANEVASRCGDVVGLLAAELDRMSLPPGERPPAAPPLPEVLCDIWR